jgi:hemin uptake protein HemP
MKPSDSAKKVERDVSLGVSATASYSTKRRVNSEQLFAGSRELLIEHAGELYALRHTRNGKLILTK